MTNQQHHDTAHIPTLATLFASPLAWAAQMSADNIATSHSCFPQATALSQPLWHGLNMFLIGAGILALFVSTWATYSAWHAWREDKPGDAATGTGAARFLAFVSLMSGGIFTTAIIFTFFANLLIPPCHPWF